MKKSYKWNNNWVMSENLNDGLGDICGEIGDDFSQLHNDDLSPIDKERLIALSIGEATSKDWQNPKKFNC